MTAEELLESLEEGVKGAARTLVQRALAGDINASEIAQLRALYSEAGGSLKFGGRTNPVGDDVLKSMADVDPSMLQ